MSLYAPKISAALAGSIDTGKLAETWLAMHPGLTKATGIPDAITTGITDAVTAALKAVLGDLWPEGWVLGQQSAEAASAGVADVDWGTWTPGDPAAAREIAGPGLRQLLGEARIRIKSIAESRLEELSKILEDTLSSNAITREPGTSPLPPFLSVGDLASRLKGVLSNPANAELVAQAEIARAQATAARTVYAETGRTEVEISTAEDDKVCPVCDAAEKLGAHPLGAPPLVPLHPRCFPAGTPVSGPRALAATNRHYEGDLVTIVFTVGDEVAVTPNHPVLTPAGWLPVGELRKGDHVFRARDGIERALAHPDDEQVVLRIEDVAGALGEAVGVTSVRVPVAAEDFHGDGCPGHDVDVVTAARGAEGHTDATEREDRADLALIGRPGVAGLGKGDRDPLSLAGGAAPAGRVGSVKHDGTAGFVGALPPQPHGLRPVARGDAGLAEHALDSSAADVVTLGEFLYRVPGDEVGGDPVGGGEALPVLPDASLADFAVGDGDADASDGRALADALAGLVSLDQVRDLRRVSWSGHVYNLETVDGWYFANGIIAHNCRCAELPVLETSGPRAAPQPAAPAASPAAPAQAAEKPVPASPARVRRQRVTTPGGLLQASLDTGERKELKAQTAAAGKGMTPAQRKVIDQWTGTNGMVRRIQTGKVSEKTATAFNDAMQSAPKVDGLVYRGVKPDSHLADLVRRLKPGQELELGEPVSTSIDPKQSAGFGSILFEIDSPAASYIAGIGKLYEYEQEAVLAPGRFRVVSIEGGTVSAGKKIPVKIIRLEDVTQGGRTWLPTSGSDLAAAKAAAEEDEDRSERFVQGDGPGEFTLAEDS